MTVKEAMTAIADKIRNILGLSEKIRLTEIPSYIDTVSDVGYYNGEEDGYWTGYDSGLSDGYSSGYDQGVVDGKQAEQDRFWDALQQNGQRTNYTYAFYGAGWTDECYNPKHTIKPKSCNQIFGLTGITDTKVPIDITGTTSNYTSIFSYATNLVTINKFITNETRSYSNDFAGATSLKNITFEGTIGKDINFQWCPLTVESMVNIIKHLSVYEGGSPPTLTFSAECWQNLNNYGGGYFGDDWEGLGNAQSMIQGMNGWLTA